MSLLIYNTLTRKREVFESVHPGRVGIYLCGPTVYMESHLGHLVGPVIFDTVKRYLKHKGYQTTLVVNITDVDDKLIKQANEEGRTVQELAQEVTAHYLEILKQLRVTSIDCFPRATEHIQDIIEMVRGLEEKGFAYHVNGDVYFDISKAKGYGKLSGQRPEELEAGVRIARDERLRHPLDFALWKSSKPGEPGWDSPWGKGRPGWHIECSVMSSKYLGDTFDIHGGGLDLVFPHHENEIAQSESYTGKPFVKYWMHNGLANFKGEKMSKSTGNIISAEELLKRHSAETIRFFLLSTHYRRPLTFSEERLKEVRQGLDGFYRLFDRIERLTGRSVYDLPARVEGELQGELDFDQQTFLTDMDETATTFDEAMDDDFNTADAIARLFELVTTVNRYVVDGHLEQHQPAHLDKQLLVRAGERIRECGKLLGLFEEPVESVTPAGLETDLINLLVGVRQMAREKRDFELADRIRDRLSEMGIVVEDRARGSTWRRE